MTDTMRWRYGETNPVVIPVDTGTMIEIGDLVYLNTNMAEPASQYANQGSAGANQAAFHTLFAGVAMQRSRVGDTSPIRVATTGVFEFACGSATFEVGALVGAAQDGGATHLDNQQVVAVEAPSSAIGRCAKRVNPADTKVLVDIVSTIMYGGPQAAA
jgi:hypothetical protein